MFPDDNFLGVGECHGFQPTYGISCSDLFKLKAVTDEEFNVTKKRKPEIRISKDRAREKPDIPNLSK